MAVGIFWVHGRTSPHDIIRWADTENMSCKGPETNHKNWVKGQWGKPIKVKL